MARSPDKVSEGDARPVAWALGVVGGSCGANVSSASGQSPGGRGTNAECGRH